MKSKVNLVKLALCGPSDVSVEVQIAKDIIDDWNRLHGEERGFWVRHQNWLTDAAPDMSDRAQGIINRQIIDEAQIIVAIFWSRFGSPTGRAQSGTEEEIRRGIAANKRVMVYFSELEPYPAAATTEQIEAVHVFRRELDSAGLSWRIKTREGFKRDFSNHLHKALRAFDFIRTETADQAAQSITGNGNIQVGGNFTVQQNPRIVRIVERREGSVSSAQSRQIQKWIEELAEGVIGKSRSGAYAMWWSRFKNKFSIERYEEFPESRMPEAKAWFLQQRAIGVRGLKSKAPDQWRDERIRAIKSAMRKMGVNNDGYYEAIAKRLKMKRSFTSLKDLTKRDLDRVYNGAMRDCRTSIDP